MGAEAGVSPLPDLREWHRAAASDARPLRRRAYQVLGWATAVAAASVAISLPLTTAALAVALAAALVARAPLLRAPGVAIAIAFSAWCALSVLLNWGPRPLRLSMLYTWLAFPVLYVACHDRATRALALRLLLASVVAVTLLGLIQFVVGFDITRRPLRISPEGEQFTRASGSFGYHLTYGAVMALLLPVFLAERVRMVTRVTGAAAAAVAVAISVARLAYLGAVAGSAVFAGLASARRWRAFAVGAVLVAAALGGMWLLAPQKVVAAAQLQDGRFAIWAVSVDMIGDHPLLGVGGRKAYEREYEARWPRVVGWREDLFAREPRMPHAHNSFLAIASQHGLPALALYLAFLAVLARAAWRVGRDDRTAGAAAAAVLVTLVVSGQFNDLIGQGEAGNAFYIALALALTSRRAEA